MNVKDTQRLGEVLRKVDRLLDSGPLPSGNIRNIDVLEALIGDIRTVMQNREPDEIHALLVQDTAERRAARE